MRLLPTALFVRMFVLRLYRRDSEVMNRGRGKLPVRSVEIVVGLLQGVSVERIYRGQNGFELELWRLV